MPIVDNVYTGLTYKTFPMNYQGANALDSTIHDMTRDRASESIVGITILPSELVPSDTQGQGAVRTVSKNFILLPYFFDPLTDPNASTKHFPKNAKMFTAPYMCIQLDSGDETTEYRLEKFSTSRKSDWETNWKSQQLLMGYVKFEAVAGISPTPDISIYPAETYENYDGKRFPFVITGFPQLPYVIDSYRAYIAEQGGETLHGINLFLSGISSMGSLLSATTPTGLVGGAITSARNVSSILTSEYVNTHRGDTARGKVKDSISMIASRTKKLYITQMCINYQDAVKIDDFFSTYGYAVNQLKVPEYNNRPCWNYVKTKECNVTGNMPDEAIKKIKEIFNRGITWWKSINTFMDYSQNNSAVYS